MMRMIAVCLLSILFVGCATYGQEALMNKGDDWPPPDITKADLLKELGPPQTRMLSMIDGKSTETLTWAYAHAESNPALFIPVVGLFVAASGNGMSTASRSLAVTFSNDVITARAWSQTQTGNEPSSSRESLIRKK